MKTFMVRETIFPIIGEAYDEFLGYIEARNAQSALNKALKQFKVDDRGVPARRRIAENIYVRQFSVD